jgi:DNA polymerase
MVTHPDPQGGKMMKTISLDIETYSSTDITRSGVYLYAESDDFEILLLSYSIDGGDIKTVDLASGDVIPEEIITALASDEVDHWAYNSSFERICLSCWLRKNRPSLFHGYADADGTPINYLSPSSWYCDMVLSAYNGLPLSLAGVGAVLKRKR